MLFAATTLLAVLVAFGSVWNMYTGDYSSPRDHMVSYVRTQVAENPHTLYAPTDLEKMPIDKMVTFVDSACAQGSSIQNVREAIRRQLRSLSPVVVDDLLNSALVEGVSLESANHNTSADTGEKATVYTYLYYIKTVYSGGDSQSYSTCVLASGVTMLLAEEIVAYVDRVSHEIIGSRPCNCFPGNIYCRSCPLTEEIHTRHPIFSRHALTWKQQVMLRDYMIQQAYTQVAGMDTSYAPTPTPQLIENWHVLQEPDTS